MAETNTMGPIRLFFEELQFGKLEKPVKAHLQNVYAAMSISLLACALGGYLHVFTDFMINEAVAHMPMDHGEAVGLMASILDSPAEAFIAGKPGGIFSLLASAIVQIGILIALVALAPTSENRSTRLQLMIAFSLLSGLNMGPLLDRAIEVDPSIIPTAFLATSLIFICFTLSALLAEDRKYLALGGILFSGLSWMTMFLFLNLFIGSEFFFQIYPYVYLVLMLGFVLYDTQLIVEKCRNGDDDYIMHCLMLFMDFVNIFRMLVIIMTDKEGKKDKRRRN